MTYGTATAATELELDFKLTTNTSYLVLTGELSGVYYENFEKNLPRHNGTALYNDTHPCSPFY